MCSHIRVYSQDDQLEDASRRWVWSTNLKLHFLGHSQPPLQVSSPLDHQLLWKEALCSEDSVWPHYKQTNPLFCTSGGICSRKVEGGGLYRTSFYSKGQLGSALGSATDTLHLSFNVLLISSLYLIAERPFICAVDRSSIWIMVELLCLLSGSCSLELNSAPCVTVSHLAWQLRPYSLHDKGMIFISQIRSSIDDLMKWFLCLIVLTSQGDKWTWAVKSPPAAIIRWIKRFILIYTLAWGRKEHPYIHFQDQKLAQAAEMST